MLGRFQLDPLLRILFVDSNKGASSVSLFWSCTLSSVNEECLLYTEFENIPFLSAQHKLPDPKRLKID